MTAPTWLLSEAGEQTQWKSYVGIFSGVNRCSWWHQWVSVPKVMPFSSPWSVLLIQWSVCAPSNIRQGDPTAVQPYPFSQDLIIDNATSDRSRKGPNHHIWQGKVQTEFVVGPLSWHRRWHDHCNIPCKIIPGLLVSSCHIPVLTIPGPQSSCQAVIIPIKIWGPSAWQGDNGEGWRGSSEHIKLGSYQHRRNQ